ncbi:nuclear distribution protein nudF [Schizosaccharomyces japonicus yFS275]|uniref:Nuclear distribution protein nudF n=1 Tax=Schizosaccharomyces japonicus (strain yFS275 / FY16936) TaxID=402676 RepID=B6JVU5_SCHJY|nr:nuclear distribution protein nudF [Schizosaccharomyces japonicus yFS275]EEB05496.2 nuclear distribution protein nudF [Schizosaccharomyces japonicus yFS275]
MSLLTSKQKAELYLAILDHFETNGFQRSHDTFKEELEERQIQLSKGKSLEISRANNHLEKKWTGLLRLQKKILELEFYNRKLENELVKLQPYKATKEIWLPQKDDEVELLGHRSPITALAFHPYITVVASASEDAKIKIWDCDTNSLETTLVGHFKSIRALAFSETTGNEQEKVYLASGAEDATICLWDATSGYANLYALTGHEATVSCIRFLKEHDGPLLLLSGSKDGSVRLWDVETGECVRVFNQFGSQWVRALAVFEDKEHFVAAGNDGKARVLDLRNESARPILCTGHSHVIECVEVLPSTAYPYVQKFFGREVAARQETLSRLLFLTGSRDNKIFLWDGATGKLLHKFEGHKNWVHSITFHPCGKYFLSVSDDRTMKIWDLEGGQAVETISFQNRIPLCVCWKHPMSSTDVLQNYLNLFASGCSDSHIQIWSSHKSNPVQK